MKSNFERIGDHIRLVDERNRDESIKTLLGLTIEKVFIPSVANTIGSDMANYKVIRRGQFACSLMQVRRDKRMPVALLDEIDEAIISQAYPVFEIKDSGRLDPEYLMMWFRRPEFDREACFHAVGGVRGSLEWEDFCNLRLPVPSPEKQREIVAEYETVAKRIALNEKLGRKLEETAQAIYKHWFVDFEFPMSAEDAKKLGKPELEGKPYRSSGGELVFDEILEKEIPLNWKSARVSSFGNVITGKTPSSSHPEDFGIEIPFVTPTDFPSYQMHVSSSARSLSKKGGASLKNKIIGDASILVTCIGSDMGKVVLTRSNCITNQQINSIILNQKSFSGFVYFSLKGKYEELRNLATGSSTMLMINKSDFSKIPLLHPQEEIVESFQSIFRHLANLIWNFELERKALGNFRNTLLQSLATK